MITLDLSILNQKGTPMFYSDITANRPAAGIAGRIFIATDSPFGLFRDTGSAWEQVAGSGGGGGNTIYTANDTLTGNRVVSSGGFNLTFSPQTTFNSTLSASTSASSYSALGQNILSFPAGFSSNNAGLTYGAIGGINLQTFAGSATFANSNIAAANLSVNSVDFSSAGSTITMTQASGLRLMTAHQNQFQYQGTNSGTITHAAVLQNLGFYRPPGATGILTISAAVSFMINDLNDYGSGFVFGNRWGIFQAGASDKNYFAANVLIGSTTDTGDKLQVTGNVNFGGSTGLYWNNTTARLGLNNSSPNNLIHVIKNQNAVTSIIIDNRTAGTGSASVLEINSDSSSSANFGKFSSSTNTYKTIVGGDTYILNNSIGDISFLNDFATGKIKWSAGASSTAQLTLFSNGNFAIGSTTDSGNKLRLNGSFRIDGQSSATAGGSAGLHLIVNLDGTNYKIALLNV